MDVSLAFSLRRFKRVSWFSDSQRFISTIYESSSSRDDLIPATSVISNINIIQTQIRKAKLRQLEWRMKQRNGWAFELMNNITDVNIMIGYRQFQYQKSMASPSRYLSTSPVRTLDQRYSSRPLETILEENSAYRQTTSLSLQNRQLTKQNQLLSFEFNKIKELESRQFQENIKLKKEIDACSNSLYELESRSIAQINAKDKQIEGQERDIRLLREEYARQNLALKQQVTNLTTKISLLEANKLQDMQTLKRKYISSNNDETNFLKKNMGEELRHVLDELEVTRQILGEKQRELAHLIDVSHQNSAEYTLNLQNFIIENNTLRNQLLAQELQLNKEIQQVQNKKELQKSRTIGILSYCRENNQYIEKEVTNLAGQLLQKNMSIESFTKELLKHKKLIEQNEKRFQQTIDKLKQDHEQAMKQRQRQFQKSSKIYKEDLSEAKKQRAELLEVVDSKDHQIDIGKRELDYLQKQIAIKDKEIQDLKDNINRMHEDHSKELSKVMVDSRVKRRSGKNLSSYSSGSIEGIEEAQGSSILKSNFERKQSILSGSQMLPVVKEELARSQGNIDDEDQSIEIKQLIMHYETMIEQLKRTNKHELQLADNKIEALQQNLHLKQQETIDILNKFSPLMEMKMNRPSIEQQRRSKLEQTYKADLSILSVLLDKYSIVSLRKKAP